MKCGENEQCSQLKVMIKRRNIKQEQSKHKLLQKIKVGSGTTRRVLFVAIGKTGKSVDNSGIDNGRTISMKK